jgi:hypothetical protein
LASAIINKSRPSDCGGRLGIVVEVEAVVVVAFVDQETARGCCASWLGKMDFILVVVSVGPVRLVVLLIGIGPFNGGAVVIVLAPARVLAFSWWMGETPHQAWAFVVRVLVVTLVLGSSTMMSNAMICFNDGMGWDGLGWFGWDELVFMKTRAIDKDSCRYTRTGREIRGDGWSGVGPQGSGF